MTADQDMQVDKGTYERFVSMFKYGAVVAALAAAFVIWLIS